MNNIVLILYTIKKVENVLIILLLSSIIYIKIKNNLILSSS
jgi:hypothetical protein